MWAETKAKIEALRPFAPKPSGPAGFKCDGFPVCQNCFQTAFTLEQAAPIFPIRYTLSDYRRA